MITVPPYLKQGDTIGIICPSGYMPLDKISTCIEQLKAWGYQVVIGKTPGNQYHYFSGTDEERLTDLQLMLDNPEIKAILFGRGGYGLSRIIDKINFDSFAKNPKWLIGYSDITVLHAHINQQLRIATIHAPMAAAFNDDGYKNEFVQSINKVLRGDDYTYSAPSHKFNKLGTAKGELIGGNLSIIAHLIGSKSSYTNKGKILFLEDIGEYLYHIDRLFIQLKRSGLFQETAGLIIGGFTDLKDTVIPFGADIYSIINDHLKDLNVPICYDFLVGHQTNNYALKVGMIHKMKVSAKGATLTMDN